MNLDLWPILVAACPPGLKSVTGESLWPSWAVTAQISRSCQSIYHSGAYVKMRPVSPGPYRRLSPFPSLTCMFVTSSTLTHYPSVCSSVCLSSSINLAQPASPKHPSVLWYLVIHSSYYAYLCIHPVKCWSPGIYPQLHLPQYFALYMSYERLMG